MTKLNQTTRIHNLKLWTVGQLHSGELCYTGVVACVTNRTITQWRALLHRRLRLCSVSLKFFLSVNHIIQCSSNVHEPILIKLGHNNQWHSPQMSNDPWPRQRSFKVISFFLQNVSSFTNNMWYWHDLVIWLDISRCLWGVHRFEVKGH